MGNSLGKMVTVAEILNPAAIVGWAVVLANCLFPVLNSDLSILWGSVIVLELICCYEVVRMLIGELKGNVNLGVALHYTRMLLLLGVLPRISSNNLGDTRNWIVKAVFISWSATEVCRYAHYLARQKVLYIFSNSLFLMQ